MVVKRAAYLALPILAAILAVLLLRLHANQSFAGVPHAKEGALALSDWGGQSAFALTGEWSFYWNALLQAPQLHEPAVSPVLVEAPGEWNYYDTALGALPGFGRATYRLRITGAQPEAVYGIRIQNQASAYRLYIDDALIAQNGTFGDTSKAPASGYRPQLAFFTSETDSFDLILQIGNDAYADGGMWEPVLFGYARQIRTIGTLLTGVGIASVSALLVMSLFFLVFFAVQKRERDVLILAGIGVLVSLRFFISGDMAVTLIFPTMPIAGFGWIDYLTLLWIQFLLLYFVYSALIGVVKRWQLITLFVYAALVSLCVVLLPFAVITRSYVLLNLILLLVFSFITVQLARAAWGRQSGAPALLGAMALNLSLTFYGMFFYDSSLFYYILTGSAPEYLVLFFVQCVIVAQRYSRAQSVEISFLKGQIRPHFIHNSLTGIASTIRNDPARTRELLVDMSSYLRGFYDYDSEDLIALEKELELVRAYAGIEQMRFGNRVQLDFDIDSERLLLPALILQPLVENAFIHGLREKESGGKITVFAKRIKNGKARVGVRDNGFGFQFVRDSGDRQGVGIMNINRRLAKLYRTRLVYRVPEGGGCEVCMEIPWKEETASERVPDR